MKGECTLIETGQPEHKYRAIVVDGKTVAAHRYALGQRLGRPIRPGYEAAHLCRNQHCINPDHLAEMTVQEHRLFDRKENCPNGHSYTEESTYWYRGYRQCRICKADRQRELRRRRASERK